MYVGTHSKPFDFNMKSLILRTIIIKTLSERSFTYFMSVVIAQ